MGVHLCKDNNWLYGPLMGFTSHRFLSSVKGYSSKYEVSWVRNLTAIGTDGSVSRTQVSVKSLPIGITPISTVN